jgi:ribosomal protein S18 acetylase RimI-like enzyme
MRVEPATIADLDEIRACYASARAIQVAQQAPVWPEFTERSTLSEIESGNLFRIFDDTALVGVFSVAYEDAAIWGDDERGAHIYLHRFARASTYPGRGLVRAVLAWAVARCEELGREGLRLDTWANNDALIAYYETLGFTLLDKRRMGNDPRLSPHYHGLVLALLERPVTLAPATAPLAAPSPSPTPKSSR